MMWKSIVLTLVATLGFTQAVDFEPSATPFVIYDEPRSLGDTVPSYRPNDGVNDAKINAFQEIETFESNGIFFAGEQKHAAIYDLNVDTNISRMSSVSFLMKDNPNIGALPCSTVAKDRAEFLCQNYITTIQPISGNKVIVCGTNGLVPVCYQCTLSSGNVLTCPAASDGIDQCPTDGSPGACYYTEDAGVTAHEPLQETAWLYLENGGATLGEVVFAGANEKQNQDSVISRVEINGDGKLDLETVVKTDKDDPDWLNNAEFIGDPIEYGEHIYYFFRETATEYINAGKIVYSRVGRICKEDLGGDAGTMLDGKWTTFQKARLNCSTQGDFPFYFNELQDIHQSINYNKEVIYATFSTAETGATGSAVCVFRLNEIQELFNGGAFKGANSPAELWLPISESTVPDTPRPGSCAQKQPTSSYDFIKKYPLMNPLVPNTRDYTNAGLAYDHDSNSPLAILQNQRIVELVVDEQVVDSAGGTHDVFFLATDMGKIFKLYMPSLNDPVLIEEYNLDLDSSVKEEVVTMKLHNKQLYIGTTERLVAVPVQQCKTYEKCYLCVQAQDPYCSYDSSSSAPVKCVSEMGGKQCLRETRDKKPFQCDNGCPDWPRPMIAFASENETVVSHKQEVPLNLYFTATGPKYSDLSYDFKCECDNGDFCTGDFVPTAKYQRLDRVEWVSVRFTADTWRIGECDSATITYKAIANGETETRSSRIKVDGSALVVESSYLKDIKNYDEMMAAYKYQVKMWEEDAIKECYADDVSTCRP